MSGIVLLGTGQVARALALRVDALQRRGRPRLPPLLAVCNSRGGHRPEGGFWVDAVAAQSADHHVPGTDGVPDIPDEAALVVDVTASDAVAATHARWLAQGRCVVSANKRGLGEGHARAKALLAAITRPGQYGDSATVGAGLGALGRLREFRACGEHVYAIRGVLSGSLAWLFDRYDGTRPFSELVREALALGYTEPDPREDVAGLDVVRKLKILARAAGWVVPDETVDVDGHLRVDSGVDPFADLRELDPAFERLNAERPPGHTLAVVARSTPGIHSVRLEWLAPGDPLAARAGCDNAIEIRSERYDERPLVLRGPGAGPALTAAAVVEDIHAGLAASSLAHWPGRRVG